MRVKNTVAIVKTTVLPVIHETYILNEKFEPQKIVSASRRNYIASNFDMSGTLPLP